MNAGRDYRKARWQAQANADWSGRPRWLHLWNGVWWITKEKVGDAEQVDPKPARRPAPSQPPDSA